jgi:ActR/RegA family two-component response regulator
MSEPSKRVLILEDDRVITDTICIILKQLGYATRGTYTHSEAMTTAREFRPNILITSFNNLCEKNGCETALELLEFLPECRVFIWSGSAAAAPVLEDYRRRGYEFEVLAKPVCPDELLVRLGPPND